MKIEKIKLLLAFVLIVSSKVVGMDAREVIKKMSAVYEKTNSYQVNQRYELFKGEKGTNVEYSYEGVFMKSKNRIYQKIDQTEFVVAPDFCLKISHSERLVELSRGEAYKNKDIDFEKTLKECSEIKMEEKDKSYFITMVLKKNSQNPFTKVLVKVNKSNFHLSQLDLYYWHLEDFSEDAKRKDLNVPHLRVIYSDFTKNGKLPSQVLEFSTYFKKKGNIVSLTGKLEKYELSDQRI